ncbi:MAG: fibro-slime domain-containing protein, partial [Fibrobacteria bacterium]
LGGIHEATPGSINLDALGLVDGNKYDWDFFFCERKECSSSLRIKTSIYFKQQRALDHEEIKQPDGSTIFRIIKRVGGSGACGSSTDSLKEVEPKPGDLSYVLYDAGGVKVKDLAEGVSYGGINIATPRVSVDTSKITDLAPGTYRIVFFEPALTRIQDDVVFTVSARNQVVLDPPYKVDAASGSLVRVIAANRYKETLVAQPGSYTLTFTSGLKVYQDSGKTTEVANGASLTTAVSGYDTLWVAGDASAQEEKTYMLTIPATANSVSITFKLPPLDLPRASSAAAYDDDADGKIDRMAVTYDRDITAAPPKQVAYAWPVGSVSVTLQASDLVIAGTILSAKPKASTAEAPINTAGPGSLTSTYQARGKDSTQTLAIQDKAAPVLIKAEMIPGSGSAADILRFTFSEPIAEGSITVPPKDLFRYRLNATGSELVFEPDSAHWNGNKDGVDLFFPVGTTPSPRPGNLVRILGGAGGIADGAGNTPGPNSRFRIITGQSRSEIKTVTYWKIDPGAIVEPGSLLAPSLEPSDAKVEAVVKRTGRLGHLIKVDLGDYAQTDDFNHVNPADVTLEYQVSYFTNHGLPVADKQATLTCLDPLFQGDCREHRGFVFIGWNFTAKDGQKAATGAYVARVHYKVKVGGVTKESGALDQIWGILRTQ